MIDVEELRTLIKHDEQPLSDIEQLFRALVGYPNVEEIQNATRADRVGAFKAACESLIGVPSTLPGNIADLIAQRLAGVTSDKPADRSYGAAVAVIHDNIEPFLAVLRD